MNRPRLFSLGVLLGCVLLATGFRNTPATTAEDIIKKVKETHAADSEVDVVKMVTVSPEGDLTTRQLVSFAMKDAEGNFRYLMRLTAPEDVKGYGFLLIEQPNGDIEQYLYSPALGQVRKIVSTDRSTTFLDSDFTFDDLRKEKPNEWVYYRLQDEKVENADCFVILSRPVDVKRERVTGYANRMMYVDKKTNEIRRIEFFNSKNERLKVFDAFDYEGPTGEPQRPKRVEMRNDATRNSTIMTLVNTSLNPKIDPGFFKVETLSEWGPAQDQLVQELIKAAPAAPAPSAPAAK